MNWERFASGTLTRRRLLATTGAAAGLASTGRIRRGSANLLLAPSGQATPTVDELTIDLSSEPATLDPALTYEVDGWSIVHSVYDSLVQFGPAGELEMLLAESLTLIDSTTYEIKLRSGITFHNGEPFDAKSVAYSLEHIVDPETASSVAGNFALISKVQQIDPLTIHLVLSQPAPWLPSQIAPWLACLPPVYAAGNDFGQSPVGTGPYRFVEWVPGERIVLEANHDYPADSVKGAAIANRVTMRFVSDPSTRVTDLLAGTAQVVRGVPVEAFEPVESGGASVLVTPLSGTTFIRIPTDVEPFSDVRVRQALNFAVDVPAIIDALIAKNGTPLANVFVPNGLGYDAALAPYAYDPERTKALLEEAGYSDGIDTRLAYSTLERADLVEAIAGQLSEAGIRTEVERLEAATFNQQWTDQNAAPLRFVSWRPMFDPFTLLSLVFSNQGFLSRHDNPNAQSLIDAAAVETDPTARAETYRQLGQVLHDEPGAIYLWSLTSFYGTAKDAPAWSPRADDYIIPTVRNP
jgi:peptide/nickel transport system substrate-binding protein